VNDAALVVWGRLNSANVQKVLWCLDDLQIRYHVVPAGGADGGLDTDEFSNLNPNRLVPVLVDDGVSLWESNVIVRYLCKQYGASSAYRDDPLQQALEERWVDWYGTELGGLMTSLWGHFRRGKALSPELLDSRLARATQLWEMLDHALAENTYIGGFNPGVADYSLGAAVHRWVSIQENSGGPNISRWYGALAARPAFQRHIVAAPL
jgi:glutathione S-transferase